MATINYAPLCTVSTTVNKATVQTPENINDEEEATSGRANFNESNGWALFTGTYSGLIPLITSVKIITRWAKTGTATMGCTVRLKNVSGSYALNQSVTLSTTKTTTTLTGNWQDIISFEVLFYIYENDPPSTNSGDCYEIYVNGPEMEASGIHVFDGTSTTELMAITPGLTALRAYRNGEVSSLPLVSTGSSYASPWRIRKGGVNYAVRKWS